MFDRLPYIVGDQSRKYIVNLQTLNPILALLSEAPCFLAMAELLFEKNLDEVEG